MGAFFMLTRTLFLNYIRDRQDIFFTLFFPIMFLLIFGFMYGGEGQMQNIEVAVYVQEGSPGGDRLEEVLQETENITIGKVESLEAVEARIRDQEVPMGLSWDGETMTLYQNPLLIQNNPYLSELARGIATAFEAQYAGLQTHVAVAHEEVGQEGVSGLEFMFPGIIAIGIASSGLFIVTMGFVHFRERGVLKRLLSTPMRKTHFLGGLIVTRIVASLLGASLVLLAGRLFFNLSFSVSWPLFLPYVAVATLAMMAFGVLITLVARKGETAGQISVILLTIMIFFSGIYLPVEFLPRYFQNLSMYLPLSYVARGLRHVMEVELLSWNQFFLETAVMFLLSLLLLGVLAQKTPWEK